MQFRTKLALPGCIVCSLLALGMSVGKLQAQGLNLVTNVEQRLNNWQSMQDAVATTQLRCQHFVLRCSPQNLDLSSTRNEGISLVRDRLVPHVHSVEFDMQMRLVTTAFLSKFPVKPRMVLSGRTIYVDKRPVSGWWETLDIIDDGLTLRNDLFYKKIGHTDVRRSRVRSDVEEIEYSSDMKRARIRNGRSQMRMYRFSDIRFVPDVKRLRDDPDLKLQVLDNGLSRLAGTTQTIEFDRNTGFVFHASGQWNSGSYVYDVLQFLPARLFKGIDVPGLSATLRYTADSKGESRLVGADVYVIETLKLNDEIPKDRFVVSVPKGTVLQAYNKSTRFPLWQDMSMEAPRTTIAAAKR